MDVALSPVDDDEFGDRLELYHSNDSARRAADHAQSHADEMREIEIRRAAAAG